MAVFLYPPLLYPETLRREYATYMQKCTHIAFVTIAVILPICKSAIVRICGKYKGPTECSAHLPPYIVTPILAVDYRVPGAL